MYINTHLSQIPLLILAVPVVNNLESDGTASFHFIHGEVEAPVPIGQEEFFGPPPHLRFLDSIYHGTSDEEASNKFFGKELGSSTPEQKYHDLIRLLRPKRSGRIHSVLDRLNKVMREDGPFDGIIGDSEGAVIAATFIIDHFRRSAETNSQPQLRCAVFISGGPPYHPDGAGMFLADQCGQIITIPTCHIIGYNDCLIAGVLALYHLCDEGSASLVDHGRGHRLPRDSRLYQFMIKGIRDLITRTERGPVVM